MSETLWKDNEIARELTDRELAEEWIRFFGVTTGVRLLGWCAMTALRLGEDFSEREIIEHGWGSLSTRYRNVAHLKDFRAYMAKRNLRARLDLPEPAWELVASMGAR